MSSLKITGVDRPRVAVTWIDTCCQNDDLPEDKINTLKPIQCTTHGILILSDTKKIVVAGSQFWDEDTHQSVFRDVNAIPKPCVIEVKKFEEVKL